MNSEEPSIIDPSVYMDDLAAFDISEEEKIAFLETLCVIMKTFVDIGWGVDSVQRVFPALFERQEATPDPLQAAGPFNAEAAIESGDQEKGVT